MFKHKIVFLSVALLNCIFPSICLDSEGFTNEFVTDQVLPPDEVGIKINWLPVWDNIDGNNVYLAKNAEEDYKEEHQEKCNAPNGLGLQNLLKEAKKLIPEEQIKAIVKSFNKDPEIEALKAFITSPKTIDKVKAIRNSQEYKILNDYICHILKIDINEYNKLGRILINPLLIRTDIQERKGIRGLINEINAVIPRQQLHELYKNLLATDDELVKAVANLKSQEFHQLLLNIKNNVPEYKLLRQELIGLGIPLKEIQKVLSNSLGWDPEFGLFA